MKLVKLSLSLVLSAAFLGSAMAQVAVELSAEIDALAKPCADIAGAAAGLPDDQAKAVATAALPTCYEALSALDKFEKEKGSLLSSEESNYFYYVGGTVIWLTAGSEAMKNNGQMTASICSQVRSAETVWGNVKVQPGGSLDTEMRNNQLRSLMLPVCLQQN